MKTTTRWLKWDGVYDLAGMCNQPLLPLKDGALKAIKQRLYSLGFACPPMDDKPNDETDKALLTFSGYCNHPTIHRLGTPATYCDESTIASLAELEDDWPVVPAPANHIDAARSVVQVARHAADRKGIGGTLNEDTPLAVRVVSTPRSIVPFSEYAAIELAITGFEKVRSILFRVYRNFDPALDHTAIPGNKLVYQEILDHKAILALSAKGPPGANVGPRSSARAFIMRQEVGGGFGGLLRNFLGAAYERLHAPYSIRVWVSTDQAKFDPHAFAPDRNGSSRRIESESDNLHYLDVNRRAEVRRGKQAALDNDDGGTNGVHRNEPDINHFTTVHDKSNQLRSDRSDPLRLRWTNLQDVNKALTSPSKWTQHDQRGTNLIEVPCDRHDARFVQANTSVVEQLPIDFATNPVDTYWRLRERLETDAGTPDWDFRFEALGGLFRNVERHINRVRRRLCCGQWAHLPEPIATDVNAFLAGTVVPDLERLRADGFPYNLSIEFCNKFMSLFSFIVHKAVTRPELDFYASFGLDPRPVGSSDQGIYEDYVAARRNKIDGCRSLKQSECGLFPHRLDSASDAAANYTDGGLKNPGFWWMKKEINDKWSRDPARKGKPIVVPSYNELDVWFFVRTRSVPMYVAGMLDMQYLIADGVRQIPVGFFEHDLFHVETGVGEQQWSTLYTRLGEVIDGQIGPSSLEKEKQVYKKWHQNIDSIQSYVDLVLNFNPEATSSRAGEQAMLKFLLFWLLHEPQPLSIRPALAWLRTQVAQDPTKPGPVADGIWLAFPKPAMPEQEQLRRRIEHGYGLALEFIRHQDSDDFFGSYTNEFIERRDVAAETLKKLVIPLMRNLQ